MARLARGDEVYPRLREIQRREGFISAAALEGLARELNLPLHHLQGLVSFYPSFRTEPPRARTVRVCRDLPCHLAGAGVLLRAARRLAAERAAAGRDEMAVEEVACLGRCERAPVLELDGAICGPAGEPELERALARGSPSGSPPGRPERGTGADPFPQRRAACDPYASKEERYGALRALLAGPASPEAVLQALQDSGLRGMGGAGFPAGLKWRAVRDAAGFPKYVVCNADESEPGTFKDRVILERWPHLVLEGLLIGMWAVGAEEAWIYVRHEYAGPARALERELSRARERGLLGEGPTAGGPRQVRIFESPGGYICGEETALLEAIEGKRAEPRNRPPFPATSGLWGRPTLLNNVETFAFVPAILRRGAAWFAAQGENGGCGLKFLALSGQVRRPGVYEVPLGITARRLIDEFGLGARRGDGAPAAVKAFAPGGPSSGFLPASELDTPLEFRALAEKGSMLGSGAVVVAAEGVDMADLALNAARFFRDESCGKCVPCREGTAKAVAMCEAPAGGASGGLARGPADSLDADLTELAQTLALTSICGLGQVALNPILSVIRYWPEEWERRARRGGGTPPAPGAGK
jgi:NADH:ubiquinone oxidoreductase subunit F (NADH-binding)/NADH:ubiquinone oxidoreductase subunit E